MKRLAWLLGVLLILSPAALRAQETRPQFIRLAQDDAASRQAIQVLLDRYHVPGISLAVVDKGKIAWERGMAW